MQIVRPYEAHHDPQYGDTWVRRLLCQFMSQSGCILLAEHEEEIIGMLIGSIYHPDPWLPEIKTLREVAWWVDEEHRMTSAGYKLLITIY